MSAEHPSSEERAMDAVVARATTDRAFRDQLLANPREAIASAFGVHIPAGVRIKCVERDPDVDALIVLPDFEQAPNESGELSDSDLEAVAGGQHGANAGWGRPIIKLPPPPKPHAAG